MKVEKKIANFRAELRKQMINERHAVLMTAVFLRSYVMLVSVYVP